IRTRLSCKRGLKSAATAVFGGKGVDLNVRFLNHVGIGDKIQDTLPNVAGDVQGVNGPHVRNSSLSVGADISGRFGGEDVHTTPGCARRHTRSPREPQAGYSRSDAYKGKHIPPRQWQC